MPKNTQFQIENAKTLFFTNKQEYLDFRAMWKQLHDTKQLNKYDMAAYALLRGKDVRKSFTPITNTNKLNNGMVAEAGLDSAYKSILYLCRQNQLWFGNIPAKTPALMKLSEYLAQPQSANQSCLAREEEIAQ